jgi:hypothetical protein
MSKKKGPEYIPPGINPKRIQTEFQSRINVMNIAEKLGLKFDAESIFRRYDALLAKHSNPDERKQIAIMGAAEIYKLLGFQDGLAVSGIDILPPTEKFIEVKQAEEKEKQDKLAKEQQNRIIVPEIKM